MILGENEDNKYYTTVNHSREVVTSEDVATKKKKKGMEHYCRAME